jgi:hypothetical protein
MRVSNCTDHKCKECPACLDREVKECFPHSDEVKKPSHYNSHPSGIECKTITGAFNFNLGNVIKYVWRAGLKGTDVIQDLRKAREYIDFEIERLSELK